MKKILVYSGSNSSRSINQRLAEYAGSLAGDFPVTVIKLTDYKIPLYSEDMEREGFPEGVKDLYSLIRSHDGLIISVPEHNGSLPAFFKNILDWLSRYERSFLSGIKVFVMSTSPGERGGQSSREAAINLLPRFKGEVAGSFSLSFFGKNFSNRITDNEKDRELGNLIKQFCEDL